MPRGKRGPIAYVATVSLGAQRDMAVLLIDEQAAELMAGRRWQVEVPNVKSGQLRLVDAGPR